MSYRVEISKTNRATCSATHCKQEGIKIIKGEIRQGALVTFGDNQSMKWRHWGCVTPKVLSNWGESSGMDMELVDGYDELPSQAQEKVKRALEQVHVDDEDWNGDQVMNRLNPAKPMQGMFVKTPKKKANDDSEDGEGNGSPSPAKKQATKKRGRAKKDDDEGDDAEQAPKKAKGRPKKAAKTEDDAEPEEVAPPPAKKGRKGKKAKDEDVVDVEPAPPPPAVKQIKGKKARSEAVTVDSDDVDADPVEDPPAPAKKGRAKKSTAKPIAAADEALVKPQKRGRGKKAAAVEED